MIIFVEMYQAMKKFIVLTLMLLGCCAAAYAQDVIRTKNGQEIQAKVLTVGDNSIQYKKYSNLDGPTYTMAINQIASIEYENGESDLYQDYDSGRAVKSYEKKKYKELKKYYNPSRYKRQSGDPYSKGLAGIGSFFVPGLGQVFDGEFGRGVWVFLGYSALNIWATTTTYSWANDYMTWYDNVYDPNNPSLEGMPTPPGKFWLACGASLVYWIWNIKDAKKIAKVKNMYYQDCMGTLTSVDVNFEPYFAFTPANNGLEPVAGLSLKLNF